MPGRGSGRGVSVPEGCARWLAMTMPPPTASDKPPQHAGARTCWGKVPDSCRHPPRLDRRWECGRRPRHLDQLVSRAMITSRIPAPEDHSAQMACRVGPPGPQVGFLERQLFALHLPVVVQQVGVVGAAAAVAGIEAAWLVPVLDHHGVLLAGCDRRDVQFGGTVVQSAVTTSPAARRRLPRACHLPPRRHRAAVVLLRGPGWLT
jgi:hypothetical protein